MVTITDVSPRSRNKKVRGKMVVVNTGPSKAGKKRGSDDFFHHILNVFKRTMNDSSALMVMVLTVFIVLSHVNDSANGPLASFIKKLSENASTKTTGVWLANHLNSVVGILIFLPTIVAMPEKKRMLVGVSAVAWCCLIPESSALQYTLQSLLLLCFFKVPQAMDKFILIGIVVIAHLAVNNMNKLQRDALTAVISQNMRTEAAIQKLVDDLLTKKDKYYANCKKAGINCVPSNVAEVRDATHRLIASLILVTAEDDIEMVDISDLRKD